MLFAKISDGVVLKYPYTAYDLKADYPQTSFPVEISDALMLEFGASEVVPTEQPTPTEHTMVVEGTPAFSGGHWWQTWEVVPIPVPSTITPRQVRLLLLQQGQLGEVETMISQQSEAVRITWEYALEFNRADPLLGQLAQELGITETQLDQFFRAASVL